MSRFVAFDSWDTDALRAQWRAARPFPHVVIDDALDPEAVASLREAVAREPHWPNRGEIYEMMASSVELTHPVLRELAREMGSPRSRQVIREVCGAESSQVEVRSYVYLPGSYLLPHTDFGDGRERRVSYALYLGAAGGTLRGGELVLYDCERAGDLILRTQAACEIEPRAGRLVLMDVSPGSLHEVREVVEGARLSFAGWFSR